MEPLIQCVFCKHLILDGKERCAAFPNGIPVEIAAGKHDHTAPHPGDSGIRFESFRKNNVRDQS